MCEFCTQHGDGKRWYLNAENYAFDLASDMDRREYMVEFTNTFSERMTGNFEKLALLDKAPARAQSVTKKFMQRHQKTHHWGQPIPIEDCEKVFDVATSIVQVPCVCRRFAGTQQEGYCLLIATQPTDDVLMEAFPDYAAGPDTEGFQKLSKPEAMAVLRKTEEEGMMHSVWTFMTPFIAGLCNCNYQSGCVAMRSTLDHDIKVMWKGEMTAQVDLDACNGCRSCVDHCPFGVITYDRTTHRPSIDPSACYGCGTCRVACSEDAITLAERDLVAPGTW